MFRFNDQNEVEYYSGTPDSGSFSSEKELMKLADSRGLTRRDLEAVWNGMRGVEPFENLKRVKKFRHRQYAVAQLWKAFQVLIPKAVKATKPQVKTGKPAKTKPAKANGELFRSGTKAANAVALLRRPQGVSNDELAETCGWQKHTVRGFISTLGSKHGVKIETEKQEKRGLVYRAA